MNVVEMVKTRLEKDRKLPMERDNHAGHLRVISWNLLRRVGACAKDVASLIRSQHPDLLLLQEATEEMTALPSLVGGHFFHHPMQGRIYGLAAWTPHPIPEPRILHLPVSALPGRVPPRFAQIVHLHSISFANVHLSHGQILNRLQLLHVANALHGEAAIVGDFNSVGPIILPAFKDVGPRQRTHRARNIISLRLDRCMARDLRCISARVLERGASDHRPILLDLAVTSTVRTRTDGDLPDNRGALR
jgi:endonuclease/exonuclease/phosphatase (EEP) superfamily protein YafD